MDGVEVNVVTLDALLDEMCKHGRVSSAVEFFSEMQEKGLKTNAIIYTIVITSFCRANNINKAMKLFEEMLKSGLSPDALVYNSLISGLSRAGIMDDASIIVSKKKAAGFNFGCSQLQYSNYTNLQVLRMSLIFDLMNGCRKRPTNHRLCTSGEHFQNGLLYARNTKEEAKKFKRANRRHLPPVMGRLLRHYLTKPHICTTVLRRFCSEPYSSTPPSPPSSTTSSTIPQIISLLQNTDPNDWPNKPELSTLLSSLTPLSHLKLARQLPNSQIMLKLFQHFKSTFPQPNSTTSLSFIFQAVFEHALREHSDSASKLYELFILSKDEKIPLTINAATLLIKRFGQARMVQEFVQVNDALDPDSRNTHVVNSLIDALLKSGRIDDALKLLDEMLKQDTGYPPNNNTVDIVFTAILKRGWVGRDVNVEEIYKLILNFSEHGIFVNSFWLTQIITKFCRTGQCGKAWDLLHEIMSLGGDVETASCNALLTGLGKERDFVKMNLLMEEMKEKGIPPNVVTFGILINHLCKFYRVDQALEAFEKIKDGDFRIEPDVVLYNTLIDGLCKVGRQEEGLKLMERMKLESKCKPNTITYNCLIDGFCKSGEIERGHELFELMNKDGVELNVVTLNTLLDGMCKHGRVSSAVELFSKMKEKGLKANAITYTILITSFCSANNTDKAIKLFEEMLESGLSPDALVYNSLISGLSQAGRMDDASVIVSKMKAVGYYLDVLSYNILISGFCRKNKMDKVSETLKDMEHAGVKPDRVTYNTVISYFCSKGDFGHAHRAMQKMISDGLVPNIVTYGALIHAYCVVGKIDDAMKIFGDMSSSSKVPPNTVIYNMLIDSLCKNNKEEAALSLMIDMKERGVRPNTTTFNAIFKGLRQRNWLDKALKMMDQMTEQACNPDYITMEILTEWLSAVGETEKLRAFVKGYEVSASTA
ncbi:pentatricopeptide repeat-containing protein At3g61520, mitochondrial-like [Olea europaea var. sylvestris]|uniref:pentatricopeptide repeat-containing protein At3g61520, mitochondrial-like n=1 Tax=Olea europaea var. sylvestris TaxID=158386 RepID=UPI000C1D510B|nr:pentatricopeptide repeat-containing protein At3g61520, mitochondrial-like [Olea europaea var. sylvestris]